MSKPASTSPTAENTQLKDIVAHAKEYGFVFQSSEIYDGLAAVYDYGPNGVELKNNLKRLWWEAMTQLHGNVVGIDAAIFDTKTFLEEKPKLGLAISLRWDKGRESPEP